MKLNVGDKVWWFYRGHGYTTFGRVEITDLAISSGPNSYIIKPIKTYWDEAFSAEDGEVLRGVGMNKKHLFTDTEFNHIRKKSFLIKALFYYRWD